MARLPFITFEGSEGCGKSTQVGLLASRLRNANVPLLVTREPGGTAIGERIRHLLQFVPESVAMTPETELLLFEASRSQRSTVAPWLFPIGSPIPPPFTRGSPVALTLRWSAA